MPINLFAKLGSIKVGDKYPIRTAGVINVGPESFYPKSIRTTPETILQLARDHINNGADMIDIGGTSTAPSVVYPGVHEIRASKELNRIKMAFKALESQEIEIPISIDTQHSSVAEVALSYGASIVNDISGLKRDPEMSKVLLNYGASIVVMAANKRPGDVKTIAEAIIALKQSVQIAKETGINMKQIIIDPSIGAWDGRDYTIDLAIIKHLARFRELGFPLYVAISRKSFIGQITGIEDPSQRLVGSLAATAIAVFNGCHVVRTHDVKETVEAIQVAEALRSASE